MPSSSQTARIVVLTGLSKFTSSLSKVGQMEAAKVWNRCLDAQQSAMNERTKWAHRNMLHQRMSQWEYGKTSSTSTTRVTMPVFRASAGRNGERVPAVRNAAISANLQAGTQVSKPCGLSGHRDLVGSINMHQIAFENKATFPVSKDVTYLRPGTSCWRYLNRSSRPDTGCRKGFGPLLPAFSEVCIKSTTDSVRTP
jgi:hypothetical protein